RGEAGDNIGVLLRGVKRDEIERGQVLAKPGSITPHTRFAAEVYVLSKDEGGRHTPFFQGYRPQFYFRTTDVTGVVTLPQGTEVVAWGGGGGEGVGGGECGGAGGVDHADWGREGVALGDSGGGAHGGGRRRQ